MAAFQLAVSIESARTLHVPAVWNETTEPETEQTAADAASIENVTVPPPVTVPEIV